MLTCTIKQSESVLISKVYTHFKKAPNNKKLGVLYVVDSVSRSWLEQARKENQPLGPDAAEGTYAAGVGRITELLPAFMNDIIAVAPEDQKVRYLDMMLKAIRTASILERCKKMCCDVPASFMPSAKRRNLLQYSVFSVLPRIQTHVFLRT